MQHLPKQLSDNTIIGMTDNSQIIICDITTDSMIGCFSLFMNDGMHSIWNQENFNMLIKRSYAASVKFQNGTNVLWLITGGENHDLVSKSIDKLDTTEIFYNSSFSSGPILPQAVSMHCIVKLNRTHMVSTGGRGTSSKALNNVDVLSLDFVWGKLPNMNTARYGHACGHYGMKEIIVAGGLNMIKTEIFSIKFSEW